MSAIRKLSFVALAASLALPAMASSALAGGGTKRACESCGAPYAPRSSGSYGSGSTGSYDYRSAPQASGSSYGSGSAAFGSYDYRSAGSYYIDPCATQSCWQAAPSYAPSSFNDPYENPAMDLPTWEEMNPNVDPYFHYPALQD
jgi:hypothetical protein